VVGGIAALLLTTCTTITIGEDTVFLPRDSVTPGNFPYPELELSQHWVSSGDARLRAWHLEQEDARGTVLLFGGNGFYLVQSSTFIETITAHPVDLVMWDYRGYGESTGGPTVAATKKDGVEIYDWVVNDLGIPAEELVLYGHSLGTFVASFVGAEREAAGIVLQNPATNPDDWARHLAPWYVRLFVNLEVSAALRGEDNLTRLAESKAPVLIAGGKQDLITAWEMAQSLHESLPEERSELLVVDEAEHDTLHTYQEFEEKLGAFLSTHLPPHLPTDRSDGQ
jgi:hypothetical protein